MSQADYDAKLSAIQAVPHNALKKPNMPIKRFLHEAEILTQWCQQDKPVLLQVGFDWSLVEDLPALIGALRMAESFWFRERFLLEEAQRQWQQESPKAYELRDSLLRAMRFAYRKNALLLKRVAEIADGTGHADLIQDLTDIGLLGQQHADPLLAIRLDLAELDRALDMSDRMGTLLAESRVEGADPNTARVVRDQAYTLLKQAVDELRTAGQYALWDNPARREGYFSHYHRSAKRAGSRGKSPEDAATPAPA